LANCPNCDRKLRFTDWKPNCPGCGVNLMFFGFEERFYEDAKRSELSMGSMRVGSKRSKAGLAGSFWAKARLIVMALPIASFLLPWGTLSARLPFGAQSWEAGIMGFMGLFMDNPDGLPFLMSMSNGEWSALFQRGVLLFGAAALAVVMSVLVLLVSFMSFISLKRMSVIATALSGLGALACVGGFAAGILVQNASAALANPNFTGALGYGALLGLAAFACTLTANLMLAVKGVDVEFAEGDVERREIWQKVKKGEIQLADLPYPVVDTAETREREALIEKELGGETA